MDLNPLNLEQHFELMIAGSASGTLSLATVCEGISL